MGVKITELLPVKDLNIEDLNGKIIAIDSFLFLYQFLTTIRQRDGSPLTDSKGRITSHLIGVLSRSTKLMKQGLKLCYVFDGKPPELKKKERERRKGLKEEAQLKYLEASQKEDIDEMKKYASRTTKLTPELVEEAKKLIKYLGLPIVQAPSEAEAQAAYMVRKGDAYAVATQDADALLFGAPKLIRNLSLLGKRKKANKLSFETIKPQLIELSTTLNSLGIDQDQLIVMSMLVGTDYAVGGVKGIGPKKAMALVKDYGKDFDSLFEEVKWDEHVETGWEEIYYQIKKIETTDEYILEWSDPDVDMVKKLLVGEHEFSEDRVDSSLEGLNDKKEQTTLGGWV